MRPKVIDEHGHFRGDTPAVWKTILGWERYKAPPKSSAAPTDEGHQHSEHGGKESMRQDHSGSIVAALDEFENFVSKKAVQHRARQISTAEAARWYAPSSHTVLHSSHKPWTAYGLDIPPFHHASPLLSSPHTTGAIATPGR